MHYDLPAKMHVWDVGEACDRRIPGGIFLSGRIITITQKISLLTKVNLLG